MSAYQTDCWQPTNGLSLTTERLSEAFLVWYSEHKLSPDERERGTRGEAGNEQSVCGAVSRLTVGPNSGPFCPYVRLLSHPLNRPTAFWYWTQTNMISKVRTACHCNWTHVFRLIEIAPNSIWRVETSYIWQIVANGLSTAASTAHAASANCYIALPVAGSKVPQVSQTEGT
jgi:hypothetical protein